MLLPRFLSTVICAVLISTAAVSGVDVKKAVGGQVSFRPDKLPDVPYVTSIIWKHINTDNIVVKAIEWDEGEILIPNPRFKGITTVDVKTGEITITNLKVEHSGVYFFEINSKEQQQRFTLTIKERVPKPVIKIEPSDNPDVVYLRCEYSEKIIWKNSAGETLMGSKHHPKGESITVKKNGNPETFYTCTLDNDASKETSEPVYERDLFKDDSKSGSGLIVGIVFLIITIIACILFCLYKRDKNFKKCVDDCCPCFGGDPEAQINNPSAQSGLYESVALQTGNEEGAENNDGGRFMCPAISSPITDPAKLFDCFVQAEMCKETQQNFMKLCEDLKVDPRDYKHFYSKLKDKLKHQQAEELWKMIDKRRSHPVYEQGMACDQNKCLVVGAGPCGLRTAIELALLGARVVVLEKRDSFTRNNVLLLWPYVVKDLTNLGAKKLYRRFCKGSIKHISIRQLQLILLKLTLILGVEVHTGVTFNGLLEPSESTGWRAEVSCESGTTAVFEFDVFLSAGGARCVPEDFPRIKENGKKKLAIGITANFVNFNTEEEALVPEVGETRRDRPCFFQLCKSAEGINLENIVYFKDETHYFVMTPEKESLIKRRVIKKDLPNVNKLLESKNIKKRELRKYARDAANFFTEKKLELEFVITHTVPDVSIFDYTYTQKAVNASRVKEKEGKKLLIGLVGDSLVEPYWPEGTGIGRGFLGVFDAAWMVRSWGKGSSPQKVLAERESVYQHFCKMTEKNISNKHDDYSIDPSTRYPGVDTSSVQPSEVKHLYEVEDLRTHPNN